MNDYLVGQLIQDLKTLTAQIEYYQKHMTKKEQELDTPIYRDLVIKLDETIQQIKGAS